MKKTFTIISILIILLLINSISAQISGSFTITGEAVKQAEEQEGELDTIAGQFSIPGEVTQPPPGGGGGGARPTDITNITEEKLCISSWICTNWEPCIDTIQNTSIQKRACTDVNKCEKPYIKIETRDCKGIITEIPKRIEEIPQLPLWVIILIILIILLMRRRKKEDSRRIIK
jgi:hypothetical protein